MRLTQRRGANPAAKLLMLSRNTVFAFALEREAKPFRRTCPLARIIVTGVGPARAANAIAKAIQEQRPNAVVMSGFAGALVTGLNVGDIVLATEVVSRGSEAIFATGEISLIFDPGGVTAISRWLSEAIPPVSASIDADPGGVAEREACCDPSGVEKFEDPGPRVREARPGANGYDPSGVENRKVIHARLLSGDRIIREPEEKRELAERFNAIAVDMESMAVAQMCHAHGIPWAAVRVISDNVDTALSAELIDLLNNGSVSVIRTMRAVLQKPSLLMEFRRLARDTRMAANRLAAYLRDLVTASQ